MYALESGDPPSHTLTWNPLGFLSHVKRRTNDDRFPLALWEVWLYSQIGVPILDLIGPLRQCPCNAFQIDYFGDHFQTCQSKSAATQVHDWVVYRLGVILGSVGHRIKIQSCWTRRCARARRVGQGLSGSLDSLTLHTRRTSSK